MERFRGARYNSKANKDDYPFELTQVFRVVKDFGIRRSSDVRKGTRQGAMANHDFEFYFRLRNRIDAVEP